MNYIGDLFLYFEKQATPQTTKDHYLGDDKLIGVNNSFKLVATIDLYDHTHRKID